MRLCHILLVILATTLASLVIGCGFRDNLAERELGEGDIAPIYVYEYFHVEDDQALAQCFPGSFEGGEGPDTRMTETRDGCRLTVIYESVVIVPSYQAELVRSAVDGDTLDAIRWVDVRVDRFSMRDARGRAVDLEAELFNFTLEVDGEQLLTYDDLPVLDTGRVRKSLPDSMTDSIRTALEEGASATARVVMTLDIKRSALSDFPSFMIVEAELQPFVGIDTWDAVL